jgi:orotate phosphoribosyltransferase
MNEQLARDLVEAAVLRGSFRLRSGATSSYYIDKYLFTTQPALLRRIATELAALLPPHVQRLAGPVLGAVPLVTAVSLQSGLPSVLVRTDAKDYGTAKKVEGALQPDDRVVLLEDIVTTGGAGLMAVEALKAAGAEVIGALCVVDREEGGAAAFADAGVPFGALFTKTSLGL